MHSARSKFLGFFPANCDGARHENVQFLSLFYFMPFTLCGTSCACSGKRWAFAVLPVPAIGLNAGYYLNPDLMLQVEYSSGKLPYVFFDIEARTLAFNAKYFFGNSFYVKGGAAFRQLAIKNVTCLVCWNSKGVLIEDAGVADSISAEFAIGNWQLATNGSGTILRLAVTGLESWLQLPFSGYKTVFRIKPLSPNRIVLNLINLGRGWQRSIHSNCFAFT